MRKQTAGNETKQTLRISCYWIAYRKYIRKKVYIELQSNIQSKGWEKEMQMWMPNLDQSKKEDKFQSREGRCK